MAEYNNGKDQAPRTQNLGKRETIPLVEKQRRLRPAECAAKGGSYEGGVCYK